MTVGSRLIAFPPTGSPTCTALGVYRGPRKPCKILQRISGVAVQWLQRFLGRCVSAVGTG